MEEKFLPDALAITEHMKKCMDDSIHANSVVNTTLMKLDNSEDESRENIYYYKIEIIINSKLPKD